MPRELTKNKKNKLLSWVIFCHSTQQWTISWSDCDEWQKVDFIRQLVTTSSVAGQRSSKAFTKAKLAKKGHGHCLVVCCQSDPLQLSYHSKTITPEKYAQQINEMHWKLQCLQLALVNILLQGIFQTQGSNLCLLHGRQVLYQWATWDIHFQSSLAWNGQGGEFALLSLPWSFLQAAFDSSGDMKKWKAEESLSCHRSLTLSLAAGPRSVCLFTSLRYL